MATDNPEKVSFVPVGDSAIVPGLVTKQNESIETGLMGYLKGILGKARNYMTQAKRSAQEASQERKATESLVSKAKESTEKAGVFAEKAKEAQKGANEAAKKSLTSATDAEKSSYASKIAQEDAQVNTDKVAAMTQETSKNTQEVKRIVDVSLVDIQNSKKEAMRVMEGAIEKNNQI